MHRRLLLSILRAVGRRRPVILLYHGIGTPRLEHDPHNLQVAPAAFRAQLELIRDAGFRFTRVRELVRSLPAPGFAAVTFDDGMLDNLTTAAPILEELGAPGTVFVQTGVIGKPNPWMDPAAGERMMTADELRELAARGWEIGGHTVTHPDLSQLDREACLAEMSAGKEELERITGAEVVSFAYPFGHYGPAAIEAARECGFESAATCVNRGGWDRYELRRELITGRDGQLAFTAKVAGIYEPLVLGRAGTLARRLTAPARAALARRRR